MLKDGLRALWKVWPFIFDPCRLPVFTFSLTASSEPMNPDDLSVVEIQDDPVAEAVFRLRHTPPDRSHLTQLKRETFAAKTSEADLLMVLFHVSCELIPWPFPTFTSSSSCSSFLHSSPVDARSAAFMYAFADAATHTPGLATLDCYDWTDVCQQQNVTSFPTIRIYRRGYPTIPYKGPLSSHAVQATMQMWAHFSMSSFYSELTLYYHHHQVLHGCSWKPVLQAGSWLLPTRSFPTRLLCSQQCLCAGSDSGFKPPRCLKSQIHWINALDASFPISHHSLKHSCSVAFVLRCKWNFLWNLDCFLNPLVIILDLSNKGEWFHNASVRYCSVCGLPWHLVHI